RTQVRELLQRAEGLVDLVGLLLAISVLEEVLLGVAAKSLLRTDLAELVVDRRAPWCIAQDLVAERDRVVVESAIGVEIDRALPHRDRVTHATFAQHQIARA